MTLAETLHRCEQANAAFTEYANDPWMVEGATREQRHGQLEAAYFAARDALKAALAERCDGLSVERIMGALTC